MEEIISHFVTVTKHLRQDYFLRKRGLFWLMVLGLQGLRASCGEGHIGCFGGISPKFHIESVVPNAAVFKGVALGKCLAHDGSELISGLIY